MKIFEKFKQFHLKLFDWMLIEPKRLVRLIILSICSVIVFFQIWECLAKLLHPPISTHSHFDLNQSMYYPAVTFCRDPAYKVDVMARYNLSYHPQLTSAWRDFPFEIATMSDIFEEATYDHTEYFDRYGLNGNQSNIEIKSSLHFSLGKCHTLIPKVSTIFPWKKSGYSITLKHDNLNAEKGMKSEIPPGWHVYLHEPSERFTEHGVLSSGRIEYFYMTVNEEIELKVTVQHFTQFRGRGSTCSDDDIQSSPICTELCKWHYVEETVGCSGPWMMPSKVPQCNNFDSVLKLITEYKQTNINQKECGCIEPCYSIIYSSFVMRRQLGQSETRSKIYIYFTSKMVTNIEERTAYDWSQFLADMSGSISFLLGLSVIGLIVVLEWLLGIWFLNKWIEEYKKKREAKVAKDIKLNST